MKLDNSNSINTSLTSNGTASNPESNSNYSTLLLVFYTTIFIIGCIGNSLVIRVVWRRRKYERTSDYFLAQLAVSDILVILANVPCEIIMGIYHVPLDSPFLKNFICKFVFPFQTICMFLSVYALTCVAYERYCTIVHRFRRNVTRRMIHNLIAVSWILSVFFSCPIAVVNYYNEEELYCSEKWSSDSLRLVYTIVLCLSQYFLPLIVISYFYSKTAVYIKRTRLALQSNASFSVELRRKQNVQIFKMFMILVIVFACCFLPNQIVWLWFDLGGDSPYLREIFLACLLLVQVNSVINPIVYGLWGEFKHDWKRCKKILCGLWCRGKIRGRQYDTTESKHEVHQKDQMYVDENFTVFVTSL